MNEMHPYERLPLFGTGLVLALVLIGMSAFFLAKPEAAQRFLRKFPRNHNLGQILLGIGLAWFWLLIAPDGLGLLSSLRMELGEFDNAKGYLRILTPIAFVAVCFSVKEFLSVRALGLLGLMVAAPLLESAFLKDPVTRLLIPIFAYVLLIKSMFWVGMPYLFRDAVTWLTEKPARFKAAALANLAYGIAILVCALAFWHGY
jgi:hypothetical protein